MTLTPRKDLLDIASLTDDEIKFVLENAVSFKDLFKRSVKKVPPLRGQTVLTLFYEPSTRTRSSFEVAASRLSADVTHFDIESSSVVKGESVLDTVETLEAMRVDYIVVRHKQAGIPSLIAKNTRASVINAGDGWHAHPTQALLDCYTIRQNRGDLSGQRIAKSRTALFQQGPEHGITITEKGNKLLKAWVWTDTNTDGTLHDPALDCKEWQTDNPVFKARVGRSGVDENNAAEFGEWKTMQHWTNFATYNCAYKYHIYCFED